MSKLKWWEKATKEEIESAYEFLSQKYEKYYGKSLKRRIGYSIIYQSGTKFFNLHYGSAWKK